jgi:hypothetical protein
MCTSPLFFFDVSFCVCFLLSFWTIPSVNFTHVLGFVVWRSYVTLCSFLFPLCVVSVVLWFLSFVFFLCFWFCGVISLVALLRCVFVSWSRQNEFILIKKNFVTMDSHYNQVQVTKRNRMQPHKNKTVQPVRTSHSVNGTGAEWMKLAYNALRLF